jgi:hypothetical protein
MPQAFEELAGRKIDDLFSGSLLLSGGHEDAAEELLVWTVRRAFHAFARGDSDGEVERWLEARLARDFLEIFGRLGWDGDRIGSALFRAMDRIPPRARVALWLLLLRRWSYADVEDLLGGERGELEALLSHRASLSEVVGVVGERPAEGMNG